jgi:hypothetical protein
LKEELLASRFRAKSKESVEECFQNAEFKIELKKHCVTWVVTHYVNSDKRNHTLLEPVVGKQLVDVTCYLSLTIARSPYARLKA